MNSDCCRLGHHIFISRVTENTELCKCPEICAAFRILEASQVSVTRWSRYVQDQWDLTRMAGIQLPLKMGMTSAPLCLCVFISGMDIKYISQVIITGKEEERNIRDMPY